jgi:outer membrane protein assembly factor BamB
MKTSGESLLLILILLFFAGQVLAQDNSWSQFRGKNSLGLAPEYATPPLELDFEHNLKWKISLSEGLSSPCIIENRIFLTGFNPDDSALSTYCIDRKNGSLLWEQKVFPDSLENIHTIGSPASASAVANSKAVYVYFGSYGILCYDFGGKLLWERRQPILNTTYGSCASPILYDSLLILNLVEKNHPLILALNCNSGEMIWTSELKNPPGMINDFSISFATPVIWEDKLIIHRNCGLNSIFIKDGSVAWTVGIISSGISTPVINNDVLYVNGFMNMGESRLYDKLPDFNTMIQSYNLDNDSLIDISEIPAEWVFYRRPGIDLTNAYDSLFPIRDIAPYFDSVKDNSLERKEWNQMKEFQLKVSQEHGAVAFKLDSTGDSNNPALLWKEKEFVSEVPSLIVVDEWVYMVMNGGILSCIEARSSKIIFRERLNAPGAYIASPIIAGGYLYIASYNGKITIIKPGEKLNIVSQSDLHEKIGASPVALNNDFYVRTNKGLYAFVKE